MNERTTPSGAFAVLRSTAARVIVAAAVAVRLVWALIAAREPSTLADPMIYWRAAQHIAAGEGYTLFYDHPTSYFPPGYPWFLGSLLWVLDLVGLGDHLVAAAAIVQALLSGLAVAAVIVLGNRLAGRRAGICAGAVLAFWPNLVVHSSLFLSETLFLTLLSVSLAATATMVEEGRLLRWRAVVAGLAMGGATLVRPQVLVVVAAAALAWLLSGLSLRDVARRTAVLIVGAIVVVAPWTIRNAIVLDAFVPVSTNDGDNLCVGFNPEATGYFIIPEACDTGEFYIDGPEAEIRRQAETRRRAIEYIVEHPGEQPELAWKKLWWTYRSDSDGIWASVSFGKDVWMNSTQYRVADVVSTTYYALVMLAAVGGTVLVGVRGWAGRRRDPTGLVIVAAAVASSLIPVAFFGDPRFKIAATPLYAVLAGAAIAALWTRLRPEPEPEPDTGPTEPTDTPDAPAIADGAAAGGTT